MSSYYSLSVILDSLGPEPMWNMTQFGRYTRESVWTMLVSPGRIKTGLETLNKKEGQSLLQFMIQDFSGYNPLAALQRHEKLMEKLSEHFLLFTPTETYSRPVIPIDFYPPIVDALLVDRPQSLISSVKTPRQLPGNGFDAILPLFQLLSQARKEPLPMTNNGQIYRRSLTKAKKLLRDDIPYESLESSARVAYYYHLLQLGKDRALEASLDVENFFAHGMGEIFSRILQYALDHANPFQVLAIALASLLEPDEWLDLSNLVHWGKERRIPGAYDIYSLSYYLGSFTLLGIWESHDRNLGRLSSPYYYGWLRGELAPLTEKTLIIEPTGDVLAPPDTALSTLWDIDGMAEIKKYDQMRVYQISRHSITAAVLDGWDADTYVRHLENMARVPVPGNLEHNIRDWFRQLTRHQLLHATVLHSASPEDSSQAERILGKRILRRLSPTDLIVDRNDLKMLVHALDKSGIPLIPVINELETDQAKKPDNHPVRNFVYGEEAAESRRHTVQRGNPLGLSRKIRPLIGTQKTLLIRYRPVDKSEVRAIRLRPITIDPVALNGVTHENRVMTVYLKQIESYEVDRS